jgi:O-antigen/teichoic acid export membrane protein
MMKWLKLIVSQSSVYGIGNILIQGLNFLLIPIFTRFLSTSDYGILSIISTYSSILAIILKLGLDAALTRHHYDFIDDDNLRKRYYGTIWLFLTSTAFIITLLINWNGVRLFAIIFREIPYDPYGRLATWLAFAGTAATIPLILFRVREKPLYYISISIINFVLSTSLVVFFVAIFHRGASGSIQGQLIAECILFIPLTYITLRNVKLNFNWDQLKSSLAFGLPLIPHQLSGWALNMSDRVLLERFVSLDQLGIYDLGYKFGMILDIILQSFNFGWSPLFFRMASTEKNAPDTIGKLITYYAFGVYLLGLGVSLLSSDVIRIISKPSYFPAGQVVSVVVLGFIMHGFYFMSVNQLFFAKQTKWLPVYSGLSAGLNILLNLVMIPRFGIMAAAWNTVIGYALLFILVYRESKKVFYVPLEGRRLIILTSVTAMVYLLGTVVKIANPYLNIIVRTFIIGLFPSLLLLFRFFTVGEINAIRKIISRK